MSILRYSTGVTIPTFVNNINSQASIVCNDIKTYNGDSFVTKTYVDGILGLDGMYFPHERQKQLRELLTNVSNEDAGKILQCLFMELTKENKSLVLSKDVESAIIAMNVDNI